MFQYMPAAHHMVIMEPKETGKILLSWLSHSPLLFLLLISFLKVSWSHMHVACTLNLVVFLFIILLDRKAKTKEWLYHCMSTK